MDKSAAKNSLELLSENTKSSYGTKYQDHILEQYKLYVESTTKYIEQRANTNTFYLTINTLILGIVGFGIEKLQKPIDDILVIPFFVSAIIICLVWFTTLQSIRKSNTAKFSIIHEFEKYLPAQPTHAEWKIIEIETKRKNAYRPQVNIERYIPIYFLLLHLALFLFVLIKY